MLPGFKRIGSFYVGMCNSEVVSGYALDAPPSATSVWRFVLPAFDKIEFLHMSLGKRIAVYVSDDVSDISDEKNLDHLLKNDWEEFSDVRDARSLLIYVE